MNEHTDRLAAFFVKVAMGKPVFCEEAVEVAGVLDALLAEHRAEVERWKDATRCSSPEHAREELEADRARLHTSLVEVERLKAAYAEADRKAHRYMQQVADMSRSRDAARDAALEEVATEADRRASLARRVYVGTEKAAMGDGAGSALETLAADLRAMKSSPCAVLPVDKVRAALRIRFAEQRVATHPDALTALAQVARDLGVDLDAKADSHDCAPSPDETCTHGRWWDSPCSGCGRGDVVL